MQGGGTVHNSFNLLRNVWGDRRAIYRLFFNEMLSKTRASRHSFIWNLILPVVPLGFYIILSLFSVFPSFEGMSRFLFVSIGVTAWLLFSGLIIVPMQSMRDAIKSQETTKLSVLSQIAVKLSGLCFDTVVRVVFIFMVLSIVRADEIDFSFLFFPIVLISMICCFGVGTFLGILNLAIGDLSRVVAIVLQYGIFVSGIIFPISKINVLATFSSFNPLYQAVDALRNLVVFGEMVFNMAFWVHLLLGLALTAWGLFALTKLQHNLKGRL